MAVQCPYCKFLMSVKGARPGRFTPQCPQCHERFLLKVPDDPSAAPEVRAIPKPKPASRDGLTPEIADALGIDLPSKKAKPAHKPKPAHAPAGDSAAGMDMRSGSASGITLSPGDSISGGDPGGSGSRMSVTMPPPDMTDAPREQTSHTTPKREALDIDVDLDSALAEPGGNGSVAATMGDAPGPVVERAQEDIPLGDDSRLRETSAAPNEAAPPLRPPIDPRELGDDDEELRGSLGGYELIHKVGTGGMGAVYLARQVSLDRNVAVKVLPRRFASDAMFVARFTREAFAAAQLNHHNVVQIHDIGADRGSHFFSMEFVEGQNLAALVKRDGRLDPELAATYVLQAARGLKYAHDHGMVHRDIKPENLLINDEGIVKVADLGLVKTIDSPGATEAIVKAAKAPRSGSTTATAVTQMSVAMGTPAYMAPEQCVDAAKVDHRADIYSLGCTLYDLITGRPPFSGKTALEVMTKHQREPVTPPDRLVKHIPPTLSSIILKMMAKRPEDRYPNMDAVIKALEGFLGIDSSGPFSPREEHVRILEIASAAFEESKWASLRKKLIWVFWLACAAGVVVCALPMVGRPGLAGGLVGFALLTALSYIVVQGITQKTHLFRKLRQLVFGASITDWLIWAAALAILCVVLWMFNLHLWWAGFAIAGVLLACGFHFTIDLMMNKERQRPIQQVEAMLRQMRLKGLEETALRQFVCKYGGENWEEFYEALFGYEAKLQARVKWGQSDRGQDRRKHAAWRDGLIEWIDRKQQARTEARHRRHLQRIEAKNLEATGANPIEARAAAKKRAERLVDHASEIYEAKKRGEDFIPIKTEMKSAPGGTMSAAYLEALMLDDAGDEQRKKRKKTSKYARRFGNPVEVAFGTHVRMLLAVIVLAAFGLWQKQNSSIYVQEGADLLGSSRDPTEIAAQERIEKAKEQQRDVGDISRPWRPLIWPTVAPVPQDVLKKFESDREEIKITPDRLDFRTRWLAILGTWNALAAGLLLLISCCWARPAIGISVLLGAGLMLLGHLLPLPMAGQLDPWQMIFANASTIIAGGLVGLGGIFFFRETFG